MENGSVSHAGRHPEKVLESLLGNAERIAHLNNFTGLPAQLALTNFAAECLTPPQTLALNKNDPQIKQIAKILFADAAKKPLRILDFGAGKGRLLEGMASVAAINSLAEYVEYFAYDLSKADKKECIAIISEHYFDAENHHFSTAKDFFECKDDESFDLVVMCNVLHEISPIQWPNIFSEDSIVMRSLKHDGHLLLVEDQRIPVGENAHEYGFIVLDTAQLRTLFSIAEKDIEDGLFVCDDFRNDGRLKAHLISKKLLQKIDAKSRKAAIEELKSAASEEIKKIRSAPASYSNGQMHGFWTQQFANASLCLKDLG